MAGAESLPGAAATGADAIQDDVTDAFDELAFAEYFGLLSMEDLVIVRPYNGDDDDRMLDELRPKYIVLFDPDPAFIRRIEVSAPFLISSDLPLNLNAVICSGLQKFSSRSRREGLLPYVRRFCGGATLSQ